MGWILSVHLAHQLGVAEQHRLRIKEWFDRSEQQRAEDRNRNMSILRAEMAERGWI
jgi:hypothetical protein